MGHCRRLLSNWPNAGFSLHLDNAKTATLISHQVRGLTPLYAGRQVAISPEKRLHVFNTQTPNP